MGVSVGIMFLIMAVVAGWLLKQTLGTTPWIARTTLVDGHSGSFQQPTSKIGLWVFLTVVTLAFRAVYQRVYDAYGSRRLAAFARANPSLVQHGNFGV